MERPRLTLARLLGMIALAGVGFAALKNPSEVWMMITLHLAILILIWASVEAWLSTMGRSSWWFGFLLFGWVHLAFDPMWASMPKLITDWFALRSLTWLSGDLDTIADRDRFFFRLRILHHLMSLGVGVIGGWVVWGLAKRRSAPSSRLGPDRDPLAR